MLDTFDNQSLRKTGAKMRHPGPGKREVLALAFGGLLFGVLVFGFFFTFRDFDRDIAAHYYRGEGRFVGNGRWATVILREWKIYLMAAFYLTTFYGWVRGYNVQKPILGLTWDKWCFIATCWFVSVVCVANWTLKAHWGRPRPRETQEFGGTLDYTHFWDWSGACTSNCSFVSGEVSAIFMILFSLALLSGPFWRYLLFLLAGFLGLITIWMRASMGAHFISDGLMAISIMTVMGSAIYYLYYLRGTEWIEWFDAKQQAKLAAKND